MQAIFVSSDYPKKGRETTSGGMRVKTNFDFILCKTPPDGSKRHPSDASKVPKTMFWPRNLW